MRWHPFKGTDAPRLDTSKEESGISQPAQHGRRQEESPKTIQCPTDPTRVAFLRDKEVKYKRKIEQKKATPTDAYKLVIIEYLFEFGSFTLDMANLPWQVKDVLRRPDLFGLDSNVKNVDRYEAALREAYEIVDDFVKTGGINTEQMPSAPVEQTVRTEASIRADINRLVIEIRLEANYLEKDPTLPATHLQDLNHQYAVLTEELKSLS